MQADGGHEQVGRGYLQAEDTGLWRMRAVGRGHRRAKDTGLRRMRAVGRRHRRAEDTGEQRTQASKRQRSCFSASWLCTQHGRVPHAPAATAFPTNELYPQTVS